MTTEHLLPELMKLADAYAQAFNQFGSSTYNPRTASEREFLENNLRAALAQPPAPEQQAPQGEERYFAYDPEGGGAELFQSMEGAMRFANESLQCHRDDAQHDGEWPDGADRVCIGVITHVAVAQGSEPEGFDYEMAPLAASPAAPEAAKPETERAELVRRLRDTAAQQERCHYPIYGSVGLMRKAADILAADSKAGGEVVYFCDHGNEGWGKIDASAVEQYLSWGMTVEKYYTRPQQQAKPLMGEQCEDVVDEANRLYRQFTSGVGGQQLMPGHSPSYWIIRATERAHGIGKDQA